MVDKHHNGVREYTVLRVKRKHMMTSNRVMLVVMLFSAIFRRKSRALMAVIAAIVGSATLFCLASVCLVVPQEMTQEMRSYGANIIVSPIAGAWQQGIDQPMVEHTTDMVLAKGAARLSTYRYENVRIHAAPYVLAGIHVQQAHDLNRHWSVEGAWPSSHNVMVGSDVARTMGLRIGSRIAIAYRAGDNTDALASRQIGQSQKTNSQNLPSTSLSKQSRMREGRVSTDIMDTNGTTFRVSGILDTGGPEDAMLYATAEDVQRLTGVRRGVDVIEYSSAAPNVDDVVRSINDMTSMQVRAQQVTKITTSDKGIITMLRSLFWIVSLIVLALMMVGVSTTLASIVAQRRNEIGLRKALGASGMSVGAEFMIEAGLYGLCGGMIGIVIGYAVARLLTFAVFARDLSLNWWMVLLTLFISVVASCLASLPPVLKATRIDPAVVLREE